MHPFRVGALAFVFRSSLFRPVKWNNGNLLQLNRFVHVENPENPTLDKHDNDDDSSQLLNSYDTKTSIKPGTVYFVSTPIGNLDDISVRAMKVMVIQLLWIY
jgi:hypothetical protein